MRPIGAIAAALAVAFLCALGAFSGRVAFAAECGGVIACQCGDTVTSNYAMTEDLGPCPRLPFGDTVGLRLKSGVTLDCQDHTITGPGDTLKDAFGIRVGSTGAPASTMTIRNCQVTKFWWGVYVQNAGDVVVEHSRLYENGWKDPTQNGTGYGLDIANSQDVKVLNNVIADNGNEGIHLTGSSLVTVDGNVLANNGLEQLYMIHSDFNIVQNNRTLGGTQGLEMRFSSNNQFSYNVWAGSPLQRLENDNTGNTFYYDSFEGRVAVDNGSVGTVFRLAEFANPTGTCLAVGPLNTTYVYKSHFAACASELVTTASVTLDRSVNNPAKVSKGVKIKFPGCTADFDLDGNVDDLGDRPVLLAAMGSVIGDPNWNAEADLDHDGVVDGADRDIFDGQFGSCGANLVVTSLTAPPATITPGFTFSVTDMVQNRGRIPSGPSRIQYYLSADSLKTSGDRLLSGRSVPALGANQTSTGTVLLTIPSSTPVGIYVLLACADDTGAIDESNETDNCLASSTTVEVGRPDLTVTSVSNPPSAAVPGTFFAVTDTVRNESPFAAGVSRIQYYLSLDGSKNAGDRLLIGARNVPILAAHTGSTATVAVNVIIPTSMAPGTYFLLACADDAGGVPESDETNNCKPSATTIQVGRPDLMVTAITGAPTTAARGTSISLTDTVKNDSPFSAGAFRVQYYLSLDGVKNVGDKLLGSRIVPILPPHLTSTGTLSVMIPLGTLAADYFVLACADDTSAVVESAETNNCLASTGTLTVHP